MRAKRSGVLRDGEARRTGARFRGRRSLYVCSGVFGGKGARVGGKLRCFEKSQFFERKKSFGIDDGNNCLIECGKPTVPAALFALKCERQGLEASHGGHFVNAIDEQSCAGATEKENERRRLRLQAEMDGGVDDVESSVATADAVTDFAQVAFGKVAGHAGDDVVKTENLVDDLKFDGFGGHAEDDGSRFVLRDDVAAGFLDGFGAERAIVAHAGKDDADGER